MGAGVIWQTKKGLRQLKVASNWCIIYTFLKFVSHKHVKKSVEKGGLLSYKNKKGRTRYAMNKKTPLVKTEGVKFLIKSSSYQNINGNVKKIREFPKAGDTRFFFP